MIYQYVDLTIDTEKFEVLRQGETIKLPKLSFELFIYLLASNGRICPMSELAEHVWKKAHVSDETIIQRVTLLRKSLQDSSKAPKYIDSIRGRGYKLLHSIEEVQPEPSLVYTPQIKPQKLTIVLLCTALLVVIVIGLYNWQQPSTKAVPTHTAGNEVIQRAEYYRSIGQQDDLNRAVKLYQLALKEQPDNIQALNGISHSLAKLVCRYNLPSQNASRAQAFAERSITLKEDNAPAWVSLGLSWDCRGNIDKALAAYLQASKIDPQENHGKSSAAYLLAVKGALVEALQLNVEVKAANPDSPMTQLQIARIYESSGFTAQAEHIYQKLFVLYPDNVFINLAYPRFLYFQQRLSEAQTHFQTAMSRHINRADLTLYYAEVIWLLQGDQQALPWIEKAAKINPNQSYPKSLNALFNSKDQQALAQGQRRINLLNQSIEQGDSWPTTLIERALIQLEVQNLPLVAITSLNQAVEQGFLDSDYLQISPLFNKLKTPPEFYQLINQINQRRSWHKQALIESGLLPATMADSG